MSGWLDQPDSLGSWVRKRACLGSSSDFSFWEIVLTGDGIRYVAAGNKIARLPLTLITEDTRDRWFKLPTDEEAPNA